MDSIDCIIRTCQEMNAGSVDGCTALAPHGQEFNFIYGHAAAVKQELDALRDKVRWRDVREELPEPPAICIAWVDDGEEGQETIAAWEARPPRWNIYDEALAGFPVLYWLPQPGPPIRS